MIKLTGIKGGKGGERLGVAEGDNEKEEAE